MHPSRRCFLATVAAGTVAWGRPQAAPEDGVTRYVRFEKDGTVAYGLLEGDRIQPFAGGLFGDRQTEGDSLPLADVKLLYPCEPSKILALAGNYRSHLGSDAEAPEHPEPFYKPISSLLSPGEPIVLPSDAKEVHYEAEFVIVIGRRAKNVSAADADDYILGYSCGNDVSERNWQNGSVDGPESKDLQWWRAKGADTFSPVGPVIASGFDWSKSKIQLRLNGDVRQETTLDYLIHKPAETVAFISKYVTLLPGDLIFTGTPGKTASLAPKDRVEVEIDGIGVLSNPVA